MDPQKIGVRVWPEFRWFTIRSSGSHEPSGLIK